MKSRTQKTIALILGDFITLGVVTIVGFASHDTLTTAGNRMLTTFLPLSISWGILGFHLGVFDLTNASNPRQLWRPFWAMVLAGPLAALLRAVLLSAPTIVPVFVVVLGGVAALGLLLWRILFFGGLRWMKKN